MPRFCLFVCAVLLAMGQVAADLNAVKAEPDLNRRAELAMANAEQSLGQAGQDYHADRAEAAQRRLADVQASVELACDSLRDTHKAARNNKYYKRVELSMRTLLRHLNDLAQAAPPEDQSGIDKVAKRVDQLHDQILLDIMSKRKQAP